MSESSGFSSLSSLSLHLRIGHGVMDRLSRRLTTPPPPLLPPPPRRYHRCCRSSSFLVVKLPIFFAPTRSTFPASPQRPRRPRSFPPPPPFLPRRRRHQQVRRHHQATPTPLPKSTSHHHPHELHYRSLKSYKCGTLFLKPKLVKNL